MAPLRRQRGKDLPVPLHLRLGGHALKVPIVLPGQPAFPDLSLDSPAQFLNKHLFNPLPEIGER